MSENTTQLTLAFQDINGLEYILHVDTTLNEPNMVADGHDPIPSELEDGMLKLNLFVKEDENSSSDENISNVKHIINLGDLCYETDDFDIDVTVMNRSKNPKSRNSVRNTTAKEITRPLS